MAAASAETAVAQEQAASAAKTCSAAIDRAATAEAVSRDVQAENAALDAALERTLTELDDLTKACAALHARAAVLGDDLRRVKGAKGSHKHSVRGVVVPSRANLDSKVPDSNVPASSG